MMGECNYCGGRFHACSSCDIKDWEWNYCNEKCRNEHYKIKLNELKEKHNLPKGILVDIAQTLKEFI